MNRRIVRLIVPVAAVATLLAAAGTTTFAAGFPQVDGWYSGGGGSTQAAVPQPVVPTPTPTPGSTTPWPADGWYSVPTTGAPSGGSSTVVPSPAPGASSTGAASNGSATAPAGSSAVSLTAEEQQMVDWTNQARVAAGLNALTVDPTLTRLAREKSSDMIQLGYFNDISPDLGSPLQMEQNAGVACSLMGAENIAAAQDVQLAWFMLWTSPPHQANILYPGMTRMGIGVVDDGSYGVYVTQLFIGGC